MGVYKEAFFQTIQPDPDITVSQWADRFRILTTKASAEPGPWRTDRTPYLREIMDELSPQSPIQKIVFIKPSQIGGSEVGFNWLGYTIHLCPCPFMSVQPTDVLAEKISKQRIAPMIEATKILKNLINPARERDSGNTLFVKEFPGGMFAMVGANSAVGLRSMPVRNAHLTEVSAFPEDVAGEGDPVSLVEKRQETYSFRKKMYLESTPGIKDYCRIEKEYLESDQRKYFIPCPHCKHMQTLEWKNLKWVDNDPNTAEYLCESCTALIPEHAKTYFLKDKKAGGVAEWRATNPEIKDVAGFSLNALYSPLGWKSWSSIVGEFLRVRADAPRLKTFVNTVLGQTWEEDYVAKIGANQLQARSEFYEPGIAPAGVVVCTAGVDVQDDRLEISIFGWGFEEEAWVISHEKIYGDPSGAGIWKQLDHALKPIKHELIGEIPISATAIDSGGHHTHSVYQYAREKRNQGVIATKGQSQKNKPAIARPTVVDLNYKGQVLKRGARVYPIGTDTVKGLIYSRLKNNEPGAGYFHFHNQLELEYYTQLTIEKLMTRYVKGFPVREWTIKKGQRNEALDCCVMAYSALQWLYTRFNRKTFFEQFEKKLKEQPKAPADKKETTNPLANPQKPNTMNIMRTQRRGKGFVTKW